MMKSKLSLKRRFILVGIFFGLSAFGFNCERNHFDVAAQNEGMGSLASLDDPGAATALVNLPYAVLNGEQLLKSFVTLTQTATTGNMLNEFGRRSGAFASTPELGVVNSPMLLAITSMAGEVCNNFMETEGRTKYISSVNFNLGVASVSEAQYDQATSNFAQAFWGRDLSTLETDQFHAFRNDFIAKIPTGEAASRTHTRSLFLATCSAFLASFDVYTY